MEVNHRHHYHHRRVDVQDTSYKIQSYKSKERKTDDSSILVNGGNCTRRDAVGQSNNSRQGRIASALVSRVIAISLVLLASANERILFNAHTSPG
jgi:hypothetical protein